MGRIDDVMARSAKKRAKKAGVALADATSTRKQELPTARGDSGDSFPRRMETISTMTKLSQMKMKPAKEFKAKSLRYMKKK